MKSLLLASAAALALSACAAQARPPQPDVDGVTALNGIDSRGCFFFQQNDNMNPDGSIHWFSISQPGTALPNGETVTEETFHESIALLNSAYLITQMRKALAEMRTVRRGLHLPPPPDDNAEDFMALNFTGRMACGYEEVYPNVSLTTEKK